MPQFIQINIFRAMFASKAVNCIGVKEMEECSLKNKKEKERGRYVMGDALGMVLYF